MVMIGLIIEEERYGVHLGMRTRRECDTAREADLTKMLQEAIAAAMEKYSKETEGKLVHDRGGKLN